MFLKMELKVMKIAGSHKSIMGKRCPFALKKRLNLLEEGVMTLEELSIFPRQRRIKVVQPFLDEYSKQYTPVRLFAQGSPVPPWQPDALSHSEVPNVVEQLVCASGQTRTSTDKESSR